VLKYFVFCQHGSIYLSNVLLMTQETISSQRQTIKTLEIKLVAATEKLKVCVSLFFFKKKSIWHIVLSKCCA
jgi:hypothetical protein